MNEEILKKAGIDYDGGVSRFKGRSALYEKVLAKFPNDTAFERSCNAYDAGNMTELLAASHELKGVCGNMNLTELYIASDRLVKLLRREEYSQMELEIVFLEYKRRYALTRQAVIDSMEE